jgi:hypothetical protein
MEGTEKEMEQYSKKSLFQCLLIHHKPYTKVALDQTRPSAVTGW